MAFSFQVAYLSGGALRFRRSLFNKICDCFWLRYVDGVTSLDLNDRSTRALGHSTLGVRWNHLVLGGDQVPARKGHQRGVDEQKAVLRRQYRRYGRAGRRVLNKRSHRLALVWGEGSDVYEG